MNKTLLHSCTLKTEEYFNYITTHLDYTEGKMKELLADKCKKNAIEKATVEEAGELLITLFLREFKDDDIVDVFNVDDKDIFTRPKDPKRRQYTDGRFLTLFSHIQDDDSKYFSKANIEHTDKLLKILQDKDFITYDYYCGTKKVEIEEDAEFGFNFAKIGKNKFKETRSIYSSSPTDALIVRTQINKKVLKSIYEGRDLHRIETEIPS